MRNGRVAVALFARLFSLTFARLLVFTDNLRHAAHKTYGPVVIIDVNIAGHDQGVFFKLGLKFGSYATGRNSAELAHG